MKIACIILAAGLSSRMGQPKLLLPWLHGKSVIAHLVEQVTRAEFARVIVVTGREHASIAQALASDNVDIVFNPDFAGGEMLSSLKQGLATIINEPYDAAAVLLGDLPLLEAHTLDEIIQQHCAGCITIPQRQGRSGHPVIFARTFWSALVDLPHDARPSAIFARYPSALNHVEVTSEAIYLDIDTPEAYAQLRERANDADT